MEVEVAVSRGVLHMFVEVQYTDFALSVLQPGYFWLGLQVLRQCVLQVHHILSKYS